MARFIKHVGRVGKDTGVVVVFREVPGDTDSSLVIPTGSLPSLYHDDLIKAIESTTAQSSTDPSEFLFRQLFHDGTNMLNTIHQRGWMIKVPTKSIVMVPSPGAEINLVDLNRELKQIQRAEAVAGTRSSDIANNLTSPATTSTSGVIDDVALASKFRNQASTFQSEAKRLMEEAEKLDPKGMAVDASLGAQAKRGRGRPAKLQVV